MDTDLLSFNGINGATGSYLLELSHDALVSLATGEELDERALAELRFRKANAETNHFGVKEGVDVCALDQTGWAAIFPAVKPDSPEAARQAAIREALQPLLDHRRSTAAARDERYYQEYSGPQGYRAGETKQRFLERHSCGPGPADPAVMPYYLLLVGDPTEIPYRVQSQLGVQRAVGRVHFDTLDEYHQYARSVVAAETQGLRLPRRAGLFGVANANDAATQASSKSLIAPLAALFEREGWSVDRRVREQATRAELEALLREAPPILFTASHGMGFPKDHPLQLAHQGALLCQDWPGPLQWRGQAIPEDFYLAGDHLDPTLNLLGTICFLFACYGAGTPELDEFSKKSFKARAPIAPYSFVAGLPKALLSRPRGGALAAIGHVERAWGYSFMWKGQKKGFIPQTEVFESTLRALMGGMPVGAAMEYFDERYAELSSDLSVILEDRDAGIEVNDYELAEMWTANNDARGYAILGDPAVRLCVGDAAQPQDRSTVSLGAVSGPPAAEAAPEEAPPEPAAPEPAAPVPVAPEEAPPEPAAPEEAAPSFSILDELRSSEAPADGPSAIRAAAHSMRARLQDRLERALDDAATIEVRTYVSPDMAAVSARGDAVSGAELRALTRMKLDGDTTVTLPLKDGKLDDELWQVHLQMVREAQAARGRLLKALVSALARLAGPTP